MAEIIATFNTVDKSLKVTMDGQEVPNVDEVRMGKSYDYGANDDDCGCHIDISETQEDMQKFTRIKATKDGSLEREPLGDALTRAVAALMQ